MTRRKQTKTMGIAEALEQRPVQSDKDDSVTNPPKNNLNNLPMGECIDDSTFSITINSAEFQYSHQRKRADSGYKSLSLDITIGAHRYTYPVIVGCDQTSLIDSEEHHFLPHSHFGQIYLEAGMRGRGRLVYQIPETSVPEKLYFVYTDPSGGGRHGFIVSKSQGSKNVKR